MIDIIMPCYNAAEYIEETIQSVLRQTETEFELICIDDCSMDNTYSILQQLSLQDKRIRVLRNERNSGIAATRNRGIKEGNAEYIAFFDDDDIMPPDRLRIGKEYLDDHQDIGIVAGNYLIFDEKGNRKVVQSNEFYAASEVRSILPFINIIPNGTTLLRRKIVDKYNVTFHEEYGIEDYRFYSEVMMLTDINILPDILLEHRISETQYSAVCTNSGQKFAKRQEALDRVHKQVIRYITDQCKDKDINIFLRFTHEKINNVKLEEVCRLYLAMYHIKKAVNRKGNANYTTFCEEAKYMQKRAVKSCLYEIFAKKNGLIISAMKRLKRL